MLTQVKIHDRRWIFAQVGNSCREVEVLVLVLLTEAVDASYTKPKLFSPALGAPP
jgi:hypothetical protein